MKNILDFLSSLSNDNYSQKPDYYNSLQQAMSPQYPGMNTHGNIDLYNRPSIPNPEGGHSGVFTMTAGIDNDQTALIPRVVNGKILSEKDAFSHFKKTGEHMGIFEDEASANKYDKKIHEQMGWLGPKNKW